MILRYSYVEDGYTQYGDKIPDVPVLYLALRIGRYIARGPAIVDTGFDGGIYPNMDIIRLLRGVRPLRVVEFEHPMYGVCEFEVYEADTYLYHGGSYISIGESRIYVPTEPELVTEEVLVGREVLNRLKVTLSPSERVTLVEVVSALEPHGKPLKREE